jgi:hypothetical protein
LVPNAGRGLEIQLVEVGWRDGAGGDGQRDRPHTGATMTTARGAVLAVALGARLRPCGLALHAPGAPRTTRYEDLTWCRSGAGRPTRRDHGDHDQCSTLTCLAVARTDGVRSGRLVFLGPPRQWRDPECPARRQQARLVRPLRAAQVGAVHHEVSGQSVGRQPGPSRAPEPRSESRPPERTINAPRIVAQGRRRLPQSRPGRHQRGTLVTHECRSRANVVPAVRPQRMGPPIGRSSGVSSPERHPPARPRHGDAPSDGRSRRG